MRSFWLASAAIFMTAGAAMAQTSTSPAPAGAANGAAVSPNSGSGNMAPATTGPHYSGQGSIKTSANTSAPAAGQATASNSSSGAPNGGAASSSTRAANGGAPAQPMHTAMGFQHSIAMPRHGVAMPADADARTYLQIASEAIKRHDKATADDALSHAETRLLTRAVPASAGVPVDDAPAIKAIENARHALSTGDFATAASDTRMAMPGHHGMLGQMSPMSGTDAMGGPTQ